MNVIDVSKYQGYIDWGLVKAADHALWPGGRAEGPIAAAVIKATGEETAGPVPFKDARFLGNWNGARGAGVVRGAYHFMDGGRGSASGKAEAEFFLQAVDAAGGFKPGDLAPVLDVEWPPKSGAEFQLEQLGEAVEFIRQRVAWPIIYSGRWYWQAIPDAADFEELAADPDGGRRCPLWIASYTRERPRAPAPWRDPDDVALWQYTDKARVAGVPGPVDLNTLFWPLDRLQLA